MRRSNNRNKTRLSVFLIVFMSFLICSCSQVAQNYKETSKSDNSSSVILTERQKIILDKEGLPVDYEELNFSQKSAIVAIEEMLSYLEDKYNNAFEYSGYWPVGETTSGKEQLSATFSDGTVTVYRDNKDGTYYYEDNYMEVYSNTLFNEYVNTEFMNIIADGHTIIKAYTEITELDLDELPENAKEFEGNIDFMCWVFIDSGSFGGEIEKLSVDLESWMSDKKVYGSVQVILLKENLISNVTEYNYTDYLSNDMYFSRENIYLNRQ